MRKIFLLFVFSISLTVLGQNPVLSWQKINESNGGFGHHLDESGYFGFSCDSIGDLDGDGTTDIIIGAWGDDDGGLDKGAAYVIFLNPDMTVKSEQKLSDSEGGLSGVLFPGGIFGRSVSSLGDIDNDGCHNVAVGAEYDGEFGYRHGAVYLLNLNTDGSVVDYNKINECDLGDTLIDFSCFGSDIASLGDLNNDGNTDLAVGCRRYSDTLSSYYSGAVYILFMNADGSVQSSKIIISGQSGFSAPLSSLDCFGCSVDNLGDLDNDGVTDIIVGAYKDDDGTLPGGDFGAVYILFLNSDGSVKDYQKISALAGSFSSVLNDNNQFGSWVNVIGDIDYDQNVDILVGACGDTSNGIGSGGFYLINLTEEGLVKSSQFYSQGYNGFDGQLSPGDKFGVSVASIGKIGEKYCWISGAKGDSESGQDKGAIWLLEVDGSLFGLSDISEEFPLLFYPNPASDHIIISEQYCIGDLYVFNSTGKLMIRAQNASRIDISNLCPGTYHLSVRIAGKVYSNTLIKK